ncbi:MAG TPA: VOC family protein [Acidimicrobiales bacterium]|nr:VOC family protein [Acidimicrobiales bacterium]
MATRFDSVVIDAADLGALARFWSEATGWPITYDADDEKVVEPPDGSPGLVLDIVQVDDPKVGKNRVHLDLNPRTEEEQAARVQRLVGLGARPADIGQQDVPWVVLADPEGNELCVLDPRDEYAGTGPVAAVVLDTLDPRGLAEFWAAATGWTIQRTEDSYATLAAPGGVPGPRLELIRVEEPKLVKNRWHLDVAPRAADDQAAEVARLKALGATDADVGQGPDHTWVVLADPEGNEFCVLSPRD